MAAQRRLIEETQAGDALAKGRRSELALANQIKLVVVNLLAAEAVGRLREILGEGRPARLLEGLQACGVAVSRTESGAPNLPQYRASRVPRDGPESQALQAREPARIARGTSNSLAKRSFDPPRSG